MTEENPHLRPTDEVIDVELAEGGKMRVLWEHDPTATFVMSRPVRFVIRRRRKGEYVGLIVAMGAVLVSGGICWGLVSIFQGSVIAGIAGLLIGLLIGVGAAYLPCIDWNRHGS